jgi:hypothetical protein
MNQQLLLKQEMTIAQILRTYGKQFVQIQKKYSDRLNGRCAIDVVMSYYGWDGKDWTGASNKLFAALIALRHAGISTDLLIDLNDSGMPFDKIADYVDQCHELANGKS